MQWGPSVDVEQGPAPQPDQTVGNLASLPNQDFIRIKLNKGYQRIQCQAMCIGAFALMGEWAHGSQIRDSTKIS